MKIRIQERHMDESSPLRDYALNKVERLERYFDGIISVEVTMDVEKERRKAQIFAHLINKKILKASAQSDDMYASVDRALEKVEKQLKKYKEKIQDKGRGDTIRKAFAGTEMERSDPGSAHPEEDNRDIFTTDMYFKKPMSADEAAMQLDSYHKDFLVFLNSETDSINIIYHRDDGKYGLIMPQKAS